MSNRNLWMESPWRQILASSGLVIVVCLVSYLVPTKRPTATPTARPVVISTDHPSEEPVTTYHSDATGSQPKYLRLPSVGIEGFIQKVGVDQHNQVAVPTNIHLAGWFTASATPGDPGLSIIDGHLDGSEKPGIFANLEKLKPGAVFTVELANAVKRQFRVATVQSLPTNQAAALLFSQIPGVTSQLNLITCGGNFDQSSHAYDHRVIVTAEYMPPKPT